jgi:transcriptional regulator with XRE-family HTH domain
MSDDSSAGNLGKSLREARERTGLSLTQVAKATKISIAVLQALERNDYSRLPGGIFSRGFVRGFAATVGLDPESAVQEFIAQCPEAAATTGPLSSGEREENEVIESERQQAMTVLHLAVWSILIAAVVLYLAVGRSREQPSVLADSASDAAGRGAELRDVVTLGGLNSTNRASQSANAALQGEPAVRATSGERADVENADRDRLVVNLSTTRPCWVSAKVDGRVEIYQLFEAGARRTLDVHRELVLIAGDAGALEVTLNGATTRALGRSGQVVTARFTAANFREYLPPQ